MSRFTINFHKKKNSFQIFSNKEGHQELLEFLVQQPECFVKNHVFITSQFLEVDHRALKILQENGFEIGETEIDVTVAAEEERRLAETLKNKNYNLNLRIWSKNNDQDEEIYFSEIDGDIYSCNNLDGLIAAIKGEFLLESDKPITRFSPNPFKVFGVFDIMRSALDSNKSLVHYDFHQGARKKQFLPLIDHIEHFHIVIDGADDAANAMNNSGLPQDAVALMQGLLIFPIFIQGVYLGFESLQEEAQETFSAYKEATFKKAQLEASLKNFRQELCDLCGLDAEKFIESQPQELMRAIAKSLQKNQPEKDLNKIIALVGLYQREVETEIKAPAIKDVFAAYCGYAAMTAMMISVSTYEAQAAINVFGGVKDVTTSKASELSLFSQIGSTFGFAGQSLMMIYAFHGMIEERKSWQEVEAELHKFQNAKDVSAFAKKITEQILQEKRDNHRIQTFGNAALATGQAMMAVGGPIGLGFNPLLFVGLGATLTGVAVNSVSELRYQTSCAINEDLDEIEKAILTTPPKFTAKDFSDVNSALRKQAQRQIFALEILGHLRAPQLALYQKFLEENKDEQGVLGKAFEYLGGERIANWLNNPSQQSVDLIRGDPRIAPSTENPYDLNIFSVDNSWLNLIWEKVDELSAIHDSAAENKEQLHQEIVQQLQQNFIAIKLKISAEKEPQSAKETCAEIIEKGGVGASYLQKKLMRAVANKELSYPEKLDSGLPEIRKNGKKINLGKLDLDKFDEAGLEHFLSSKRAQKNLAKSQKKSPLEQSRQKQLFEVKSDHLRPFFEISKVSNIAAKNTESKQQEQIEKQRDRLANPNELILDPELQRPKKIRKQKSEVEVVVATKSNDDQSDLLRDCDELGREEIAKNESRRQKQIEKQNNTIDRLVEKRRKFILTEKFTDAATHTTTFIYLHPDHQNREDPACAAKQITLIRNDITKKIDVIHGDQARALLIKRPSHDSNLFIAQISKDQVKFFGDEKNNPFVSFKKDHHAPSKTPTLKSQSLLASSFKQR